MLVDFTVREIHDAAGMRRFALLNQGANALVVLHKFVLARLTLKALHMIAQGKARRV